MSNSCFPCLFFLLPYPVTGFGRSVVALSRYRYDVAELKKGRVSLAKHARSSLPQPDPQSCGKKPCLGGQTCPSINPGTTHNPCLVRVGEICPVVQACNDIFLSIYLSIYPSIHRIGGGLQGSMRAKDLEELAIIVKHISGRFRVRKQALIVPAREAKCV